MLGEARGLYYEVCLEVGPWLCMVRSVLSRSLSTGDPSQLMCRQTHAKLPTPSEVGGNNAFSKGQIRLS